MVKLHIDRLCLESLNAGTVWGDLLKIDEGNECCRENLVQKRRKVQAGIDPAAIICEIKAVIRSQLELNAEGRSLAAEIDGCPKKRQIGAIISQLNAELESSAECLEELIARFNSV